MELKELTEKIMELFKAESIEMLADKVFIAVKNNDENVYEKFCDLVQDLSIDWMQKIYQYHLADRKEKMQDYTPRSLAEFISRLVGKSDVMIDMCAGSGALTIQNWNMTPEQKFELYEFDKNVIPFLLFNMAVRNINCTVYHADVLKDEVFHVYTVSKGDKYGEVKEVEL